MSFPILLQRHSLMYKESLLLALIFSSVNSFQLSRQFFPFYQISCPELCKIIKDNLTELLNEYFEESLGFTLSADGLIEDYCFQGTVFCNGKNIANLRLHFFDDGLILQLTFPKENILVFRKEIGMARA